jgi:hypothetical protein
MRWAAALALALALACGATASAQTNPVVSHYRAYRAAFDAGRYAEAEAPAEAAFGAAEAAGDPRAGVLALNLAVLRALKLQKLREAVAPAQRALALGGEGVDPDQTRLLVALAELPRQRDASAALLESGISQALAKPSPPTGFLYEVSIAWGMHDLSQRRAEPAERAFAFAVQLSEHDQSDVDRAVALTGRGAARTAQAKWTSAAADLG